MAKGLKFSEQKGNSLFSINSNSDFLVGFILRIKFKALCTHTMFIQDMNTKDEMRISKEAEGESFKSGEQLIIDTRFGERKITFIGLDGKKVDYYKQMTINSEWLTLSSGENNFKIGWEITPSSTYIPPDNFCNLAIEYSDTYLEVEGCY